MSSEQENKKKGRVKITSEQSKKIVSKLEQMWLPGMEPAKTDLASEVAKKVKASVKKTPKPSVRSPKF